MTIDTSREAVERLLARAEAAEAEAKQWAVDCEEFRRERDAALAEVARLSTPPDDAEVAEMVALLVDRDNPVGMQAADFITRLSHVLALLTQEGR